MIDPNNHQTPHHHLTILALIENLHLHTTTFATHKNTHIHPLSITGIMMQDMQEIRDLERQSKKQTRTIKRQGWAIVTLFFITIGLLAATIVLGVRHAQMTVSSSEASTVPEAPPVGRRLVVVPVSPSSKGNIHPAPLVVRTSPTYPITNSTNGSSPDSEQQQCDPGSVWGGRALDELNHGYMALMQKALSDSPAGVAGEITDYYHTALQSVFRCGESMEFGQLQVVEACKSGYVGKGEKVECDEGGSYGDFASGST